MYICIQIYYRIDYYNFFFVFFDFDNMLFIYIYLYETRIYLLNLCTCILAESKLAFA